MNDDLRKLIQAKIDAWPPGAEFDLKTLMGPDWGAIQSKQAMGQLFKKAISKGIVSGAIHVRLDNSPRRDVYRHIGPVA